VIESMNEFNSIAPGTQLRPYEIVGLLDSGCMGGFKRGTSNV